MFWNKLWPLRRPPRKRTAPPIELPDFWLGLTRKTLSGQVLDYCRQPGHSWVRNAYNAHFGSLGAAVSDGGNNFGAGYMTARRMTGQIAYTAGRSFVIGNTTLPAYNCMISSVASSAYGVLLGSGDTAWDIDDYKLDTLIEHGAGAGQLSYSTMSTPTMDYTSKIWTVSFERSFSNFSGASVFVKEVALADYCNMCGISTFFMLARDVLASALEVEDESILTVEFEISKDFSAID
jgi:hypothetical protein